MAPRTILVVDDEPQIRGLIRNVLERENYRVLEAEDGEEALTLCERSDANVSLLLTDIVMPNLDGIELARRIRALKPDIRVIYMSGKCEIAMVERDLRQLGFGFIKKPFALPALLGSVREALGTGRKTPAKSESSAAAGDTRTA